MRFLQLHHLLITIDLDYNFEIAEIWELTNEDIKDLEDIAKCRKEKSNGKEN